MVADAPGIDQRTLARTIDLDTPTSAGVIDRPESRGLMLCSASPEDSAALDRAAATCRHESIDGVVQS